MISRRAQVRSGRAMPRPLRLAGPRCRRRQRHGAGRRGVAAPGAAHAATAGGTLQTATGARLDISDSRDVYVYVGLTNVYIRFL